MSLALAVNALAARVAAEINAVRTEAAPIRTDIVSSALIYQGYAASGTDEDSTTWAIRRLIRADGVTTASWASGPWSARATLSYS